MLSLEALYTNKGGEWEEGDYPGGKRQNESTQRVAHLEYILHLSPEIVPFPRPQREN